MIEKSFKAKVFHYEDREFYWQHGYYRHTLAKKVFKMSSTIYVGGKVLATLKSRRFSALTKLTVHAGGICELSPDLITLLTTKGVLFHAATPAKLSPPPAEASHPGPTGTEGEAHLPAPTQPPPSLESDHP